MRVALIGLGDVSGLHLHAIEEAKEATLVAACDIDPTRRQALPQGIPLFTCWNEMFETVKPDVVHICLPHHLHFPAALDAAKHGVHIFAEKPLAVNLKEAYAYLSLEQTYHVQICICLQNRLNPTSVELIKRLESGRYGRIQGVRGLMTWKRTEEYYANKPWRGKMDQAGGGCMINQALHTLDLIQYFMQSEIVEARGAINNFLPYDIEVEDTATARLTFANGATGFFCATVSCAQDIHPEITIFCERAEFWIRNQALTVKTSDYSETIAQDDGDNLGKSVYGNSHIKLIHAFYQKLNGKGGLQITPQEAFKSMRLIDAIRQSSIEGKPIQL